MSEFPDFRSPDFLRRHIRDTLAFYHPHCLDPAGGLAWEHYDRNWDVDWNYHKDKPNDLFKPWSFQPGHQTEWAKLLLILTRDGRKYSDEKSDAGKADYHNMGACYEVLDVIPGDAVAVAAVPGHVSSRRSRRRPKGDRGGSPRMSTLEPGAARLHPVIRAFLVIG